ncbi:MAG: PorV/PorQ family protein [bacterium]
MKNKKLKIKNKKWLLVIGYYLIIASWLLVIPAAAITGGLVSDPMSIGVGARPLGMGRAYVGVAEDADAIFTNPAGIARITNPKLSSMYTSLLQDVDYMVVGGAYPFGEKSAVGAGIINSSTSSIRLRSSNGEDLGIGRWGNSVMFLSYGTYASELPVVGNISQNLNKDILLGTSLKYFSTGGAGLSMIEDAAGSGYSVDLGALYPVTDFWMLGANYQNAVGGVIQRSSGIDESIAPTLKLGSQFTLLGKEGRSYTLHRVRKLYANVDYDINSNGLPNAAHYGLEFWPSANLALRMGSDNSELTAGLGLRFSGIEFNYAYHPFDSVTDNDTHFFSLSYLGEANKRMLKVQVNGPIDKSIIHEDFVKVHGRVEVIEGDEEQDPMGEVAVKVNGINILVNRDMTFSSDIPLDTVGKHMVLIEASDNVGDYGAQEVRIVRLINFADVPDGHWARQPIENTGTVGLVNGYPDGTFRPEKALTRAELATMLVRAKGLPLPERRANKIFKDVNPSFWGAKYVEVAYKAGLIKGYPDGSFRPNNRITKAEGVAVMVRFDNLQYAQVVEKPYWDVETNFWAARAIQTAKEAGMLKFIEKNTMGPNTQLVRSETMEMFSKTNLAGGKIEDLYMWEKGFRQETIPVRPKTRASIF